MEGGIEMERPEIDYWTEKQPFCDIRECCDIQDVKKLEVYTDHLESQLEKLRAEKQEQNKTIGKLLDEATVLANENETLKAEKQEAVELLKMICNNSYEYLAINRIRKISKIEEFLSKHDGE